MSAQLDGSVFRVFLPIGRFVCKDGASLSIQGGSSAYSEPREDGAENFSKVEVGFPSGAIPESWLPFADSIDEDSMSEIFAFIPVELVEEFFTLHGGMDIGRTVASLRARSVREIDTKGRV